MLGLVLKLAIEWRIAQLVSVLNTLFNLDWFEFAAGAGITDQKDAAALMAFLNKASS
jgi:hypothetical protein